MASEVRACLRTLLRYACHGNVAIRVRNRVQGMYVYAASADVPGHTHTHTHSFLISIGRF